MAVTAHPKGSSLVLYVEDGITSDGSAKYSTRTIGRVNPAITDEVAYNFAASVGTLQIYPVGDIERVNKSILTA